jgi:DNA mismatch repair protein MutS
MCRPHPLARALATLDALCALAERSLTLNWCAPQFVPEPCIEIEAAATRWSRRAWPKLSGGAFIANDTRWAPTAHADHHRPQHGRQITYMRQVALIVLLASMGSYVPATACRLGPIDAIHTRIGAADDLANAQSTFMLEMTEAAQILHSRHAAQPGADGRDRPRHQHLRRPGAGQRHCHHLHDKTQAFTLFATHYFELTELPGKPPRGRQHARERGRERAATSCSCTRSSPARPAAATASRWPAGGHARAVLNHARHALARWKSGASASRARWTCLRRPPESAGTPTQRRGGPLADINPDALSPREALDALYKLKKLSP